jgi:hypothetical protein
MKGNQALLNEYFLFIDDEENKRVYNVILPERDKNVQKF